MRGAGFALVLTLAAAAPLARADSAERLRSAKTLAFDGKYAEARAAWQQVLASASGGDAELASFWIARCSEKLKEDSRALREYSEFLASKPADRGLVEEAKTSRVGVAARLATAGATQHLAVVKEALQDPSKTVRYYAAFQLAAFPRGFGRDALPVLKRIVAEEKDPDLVDRARLLILRVDPQQLAPAAPIADPPRAPASRAATWLKVRIYERGSTTPSVAVSVPFGLAELAFKSLPDDARKELRREGIDGENLLQRLREMGPTEILRIEGNDGEKIQIWLE